MKELSYEYQQSILIGPKIYEKFCIDHVPAVNFAQSFEISSNTTQSVYKMPDSF